MNSNYVKWVIVLFQSSIASLNFSQLPLSTIFILTFKTCFLWGIYSSSLCFFCLLSHYFWIEYFLIFIFMVFNGSLATELTLVQHRFELLDSTYTWIVQWALQYYTILNWLEPQILRANCKAMCRFSTAWNVYLNTHAVQGSPVTDLPCCQPLFPP